MNPIHFPEVTQVIAEDQPQYLPLPAFVEPRQSGLPYSGTVVSCWRLTFIERFRLLITGKLWLNQLTFGQDLQPQRPSALSPWQEGTLPIIAASGATEADLSKNYPGPTGLGCP